jgi:hypothetical protein
MELALTPATTTKTKTGPLWHFSLLSTIMVIWFQICASHHCVYGFPYQCLMNEQELFICLVISLKIP